MTVLCFLCARFLLRAMADEDCRVAHIALSHVSFGTDISNEKSPQTEV